MKSKEPIPLEKLPEDVRKRAGSCLVFEIGEVVGTNRFHTAITTLLTVAYKMVNNKLVVTSAFPGYP